MAEKTTVVATDNLYDYSVAAAGCRLLAAQEKELTGAYPVLVGNGGGWGSESFLSHYGVRTVDFAELVEGSDPVERSHALAEALRWNGRPCVEVGRSAAADALLPALARALAGKQPLLLGERREAAATTGRREIPAGPLLIVRRGSPMALPAALYAEAGGKHLVDVASFAEAEEVLTGRDPGSSAIVVDDLESFTKARIERLLELSQAGPSAPLHLGILSAYSPGQLSAVVCRWLIHRDFHRRGGSLLRPTELRTVPVAEMEPMEFYVVCAHGNELHLRHRGKEVLCGAATGRAVPESGFDCEARCVHHGRVKTSAIPAQSVLLLSCDAFTLGEGLVPPEYNLMLNLLNGWTTSVLAPYKHVQANFGLFRLAHALVQAGASLGEVAQWLNSVARLGEAPEVAYLVLGDPDLVVQPAARRPPSTVEWKRTEEGLEVECREIGGRLVELTLPEREVTRSAADGETVALEPLSENVDRADLWFALRPLPRTGEVGLLLFTENELAGDTLRFRLQAASGLAEEDRQAALDQLRRLSRLTVAGVDLEVVRSAEAAVLELLRIAAGYPRPVELMLGNAMARNLGAFLRIEYRRARHAVLGSIRQVMESDRLWISQKYSQSYTTVRLVPGVDDPCSHCGNKTFRWLHEDRVTDLPARHLSICSRCGIIGDRPVEAELELGLDPLDLIDHTELELGFTLRNRSSRPIELSAWMQFNQWKQFSIESDGGVEDLTLQPEETVGKRVRFRLDDRFPDDRHHVQLFAVSDRFDLYCATQTMQSVVRGAGGEAGRPS